MATQEEVAESELGGEGELVEALSFAFGEYNEVELPIDMSVKQPPA